MEIEPSVLESHLAHGDIYPTDGVCLESCESATFTETATAQATVTATPTITPAPGVVE